MTGTTRMNRPRGDLCRNAAIVPILQSMYGGMMFDAGDFMSFSLDEVRRVWAEMAYMVADWCGDDRIRISNVYSLVPSYFGSDSVEGMDFVVGLDLMCGDIVDLGRVLEVVTHEKSLDLVTYNGMVSVIIPPSKTGLDLATQIKMCMRRLDITDALPAPRFSGVSAEEVRVYSESAFVYNIGGRPMTARGIACELGCGEDDVADVLRTAEGQNMLKELETCIFQDGGHRITESEVMVYNFAERRVNRTAQRLGVPPSQVRVAPHIGPIRVNDPVACPIGTRIIVCEGVARTLAMWSARLRIPVMCLAGTWKEGLTEREWVKLASPSLISKEEDGRSFQMWRK